MVASTDLDGYEPTRDKFAKMSISENAAEHMFGNVMLAIDVTNEALLPFAMGGPAGAAIEAVAVRAASAVGKKVVDRFGFNLITDTLPRFTQTTASRMFSTHEQSRFAGRTIADVANSIKQGAIKVDDVPVEVIVRNGKMLVVNTRSSLALRRAGVPVEKWRLIDKTGDKGLEKHINARLRENGLGDEGIETIRITGQGQKASSLE